jgi:hypothetical protein
MNAVENRQSPLAEPQRRMQTAPLLVHFFRALFLRRDFFERVASDPNATRPAVAIVCLSSLAYGGTLMPISPAIEDLAHALGYWILPLLMLLGVARWAIYTTILWVTGSFVLRQRPEFGRLLRCLGFAQAPAFLSLVVLVDASTELWLHRVIQLWLLASTIVAVRAAFATTLGRAVATGALGYVLDSLLPRLVALLLLMAIEGR